MMNPATASLESDHVNHGKELSPSSSSSPPEDPLELDANVIVKSSPAANDSSDDDIPVRSMSGRDKTPGHSMSSNGGLETQFPEKQLMERSEDSYPSTSYRIPSHVFARTRSNTPVEWSVASNESLFSIHTGNASFTKDQFSWMDKSGELGLQRESSLLFSGPLLDFSIDETVSYHPSPLKDFSSTVQSVNNQPAVNRPAEDEERNAGIVDEQRGVTTPEAVEPIKEVKHENVDEFAKEISFAKRVAKFPGSCRRSDASGSSVKSFAFPILTRDTSGSATQKGSPPSWGQHSQPQTPKGLQWSHSKPRSPPSLSEAAQRQPGEQSLQKTEKTSSATPPVACCAWFSCFTGRTPCS